MNIIERMKCPTPPFFKKLRNVGLVLAALGGAIVASPIVLPVGVVTIAGYIIIAGGVATAVSQSVTCKEDK